MAYAANEELFAFTNTTAWPTTVLAQPDPLISIGGWAPVGQVVGSRAGYRPANTDAPHITAPSTINDTQIDGGPADPVTGDWCWMMLGNNAGTIAKIVADDQVSVPGTITIDREIPDTAAIQNNFRTFKRENVFDNIDAAGAIDGYVDYRQIWFIHNNGANEGGFQFHIDPIQPNGCAIELTAGARARLTNGTSSQPFIYLPADRFEDPFGENGVIKDLTLQNDRYSQHARRARIEGPVNAVPPRGTTAFSDVDQWIPIWLKRTVRPGTRAGECVFRLVVTSLDATGPPNPDPYESGMIMVWFVDQPTYSVAIEQDRIAYTDRSARLKATITDDRGVVVPNLNAWMVIDSGPGTVTSDMTGRTDESGIIRALYNSPSATGAPPVIRVIIPTNPET